MYCIQHCFISGPSESTMSEDGKPPPQQSADSQCLVQFCCSRADLENHNKDGGLWTVVEGRVYDVQVHTLKRYWAINPPKRYMKKCTKWSDTRVLFTSVLFELSLTVDQIYSLSLYTHVHYYRVVP
jgi:hypothetical protein